MDKDDIKKRTRTDAVRIIKLCNALPKTIASLEIAKQIIRSSMSVGSNYRAACRAKSQLDFIYKIAIIIEEADETLFWLEIIEEANLIDSDKLKPLMKEYNDLVAIFSASSKTAKLNLTK